MIHHLEIRRGTYYDSVTLMAVSRRVGRLDGVDAAMVAMATELNLQLLADMGFYDGDVVGFDDGDVVGFYDGSGEAVGPNDLLIAVAAVDEAARDLARDEVSAALAEAARGAQDGGGLAGESRPRTIGAVPGRTGPCVALVSVPGPNAFVEAMDALRAGMHVMVFSDNVPVDQEVALKAEGHRRDLLVMGPDCGTAIISGVGLGFANAVRPGPVGIVAASGTGAQQLACLLDGAGLGLTHLLGVGGRDLSAEVDAASTLQALAALDADPATEVIAVVSKPADPGVAGRVRAAADACVTPVVLALVGRGEPDLTAAAGAVAAAVGVELGQPRWWPAPELRTGHYPTLRGLFAGGTLCDEAMAIAADAVGPIASNIPLQPEWTLGDDLRAHGHAMIDFGDDRLTRGRPHPMIDHTARLERIAAEAVDPNAGVALLDVVLGHGAHPDPAAELAPAIEQARATARSDGRDLAVVISLCGTRQDPQGRDRQAERLRAAGASVHLSNAAAARKAVELLADAAREGAAS